MLLLVQPFGEQEEQQSKPAEAIAPPALHALPDDAAGVFIPLAGDNDINALLATTVLEKSGALVVRQGLAEDRAAYLAAGLDDYLAKPFEKADLTALFARWGGKASEAEQGAGLGAA